MSIYTDFVVLEVLSLRLLTGGEGRGEGEEEEEWAGKSVESVVGPLLVEEPLEVAATAGGESLEKEREREREVCGLNVLRQSCCTFFTVSSQLTF